jgi:hypothetical protein
VDCACKTHFGQRAVIAPALCAEKVKEQRVSRYD